MKNQTISLLNISKEVINKKARLNIIFFDGIEMKEKTLFFAVGNLQNFPVGGIFITDEHWPRGRSAAKRVKSTSNEGES